MEQSPIDAAYTERNAVVAALIRTNDWRCWRIPAPDAPGWWIVYAETPAGQVSWHFGGHDLGLFEFAPHALPDSPAWDGHTTEEKYRRVAALGRRWGGAAVSEPLTPQQDAIMRLVARGMTNKEIAAELFVVRQSVQNQLYLAFQKLGATNRLEAAVKGGYLVPREDLR